MIDPVPETVPETAPETVPETTPEPVTEPAPEPVQAAAPDPDADAGTDVPMTYDAFGEVFLRRVLHLERVLRSIDRILGPTFELGPIGAGPGRKIARLTARGQFLPTRGEEIAAADVAYRVWLPVSVDFELDLRVDTHRFHAQVLVPLIVRLRLIEPLTILWDITPPTEEDLQIEITGESRRSTALQKLVGLDGELRRFLLRFVDRELEKEHVLTARRIHVDRVIDGAWPEIADQFLPIREQVREPADVPDPPAEG